MKIIFFVSALLIVLIIGVSSDLWATIVSENEVTEEELLFMEIPIVATVARKEQSLSETAAAAYVITREDIRRSGASNIPEALRLAPGIHVANIDANKWAISIRGFNRQFANKLLVMIDGRTVYTPLYSGVYWNVQDTMLEDIERIEVIRGPGGTLWGTNAVNGIINIITRSAKDTLGSLVHAGGGTLEKDFAAYRYGGKIGENIHFRGYAKYFNRDDFDALGGGNESYDEWDTIRGGFRIEWDISNHDIITVQGDIYDGEADQSVSVSSWNPPSTSIYPDTVDIKGGNILLHWNRILSDASDWKLQAYFDSASRDEIILGQRLNTYDIDFQHRFPLREGHELTWGIGYRLVSEKIRNTFSVSYTPDNKHFDLLSFFIQDEITLKKNLRLTLGSKFEYNDFSGFEYQPGVRFLWQMRKHHALWGAISRTVRTPSPAYTDMRVNVAAIQGTPNSLISVLANPDFDSEKLLSFEIGYRTDSIKSVFLDVTAFYNVYDDLYNSEFGNPLFEHSPPPPHLLIPLNFENFMEGETYGIEFVANWQVRDNWRLNAGYTWLQMDLRLDPDNNNSSTPQLYEGSSPDHQIQLRSHLDLPHNLEFDTILYYVDSLPSLDIPDYTRLDLRFGWRPISNLELSLTLQNLLDNRHQEFNTNEVVGSEIPSAIYGKATWRF